MTYNRPKLLTCMEKKWCFTCGNAGFADRVCPSCGRKPSSASFNFEEREDTQEFAEKIDAFGVPGNYRGICWSKEALMKYKTDLQSDYNFVRFAEQLEKIHSVFARGMISPKSAIIIAPADFSKMTFAYSCMQHALDHNLSVAPLLDTLELKRLLVLAAENPNYKMFKKISYDEYIMCDVCFITVTKLKQREYAYETIQEVIDRRTRKGLGTFIISRYDLSEISRRDYGSSFEAITSSTSQDTYKYPAVVMYRQLFRNGGDSLDS